VILSLSINSADMRQCVCCDIDYPEGPLLRMAGLEVFLCPACSHFLDENKSYDNVMYFRMHIKGAQFRAVKHWRQNWSRTDPLQIRAMEEGLAEDDPAAMEEESAWEQVGRGT